LDTLPKEKTGGLPVLATALRCIPYVIPEHWEGTKLAEDLPGNVLSRFPRRSIARNGFQEISLPVEALSIFLPHLMPQILQDFYSTCK
jgi:hypothetical protein